MLAHADSPYFSKRARQSWRTLAYFGLAIPFLVNLHASATIFVLTAMLFAMPSIWNLVQSHRERHGDKRPATGHYQARLHERREFAKFPFADLLDEWKAELSFEDTVTEAAYCSNEYGRRLSVICVRIPGLPSIKHDPVADLLRANGRKIDQVECVGDEEFLVCSHLLRDALSADVILDRLKGAFRRSDLTAGSLEVYLGKAVYPLDGYTGADLIGAARSKLQPLADLS